MNDLNSNKNDPPVTVVVSRQVKPGCEQAFEEFISGITAAAMTFEGHLGTNIFRPSNPTDTEYRIIFKFDLQSNLHRWEESECRRQWLARAESLTLGPPMIEILTGLETWFTLPISKPIVPPPRHKMALLTWLAIFPLINIINLLFASVLDRLPPLLRNLVLTVTLVLLMTYVVMPRMTRLFASWLYPNQANRKRKKSHRV